MTKSCQHFLGKDSILDAYQGSEYASVVCYSLFGKTKDANKTGSVAKI